MADTMREKLIELLKSVPTRGRFCDLTDMADHLIANGVTVQEWIPVMERLPEGKEKILVTDGHSVVLSYRNHFYRDGNGNLRVPANYGNGMDVTHWMPLPEPPKGE